MASHSQLKYGARLINSFLGNNATISCCEVLNSLIYPAHEQHHNNSFLCAALVMGQSNIAAGATIGSNHNSRAADGEIIAGRGFWPGLCVSLKHNSRFASFNLIAKGDYSSELDIPFPFSLISNDESKNQLVVMPAYWFMYNMYALARNAHKYVDRDKRIERVQHIEYDYLAPDSVNEIFEALRLLQKFTAIAVRKRDGLTDSIDDASLLEAGRSMLENPATSLSGLEIIATGVENSSRPTILLKVQEAYRIYKELIIYYAANQLLNFIEHKNITSIKDILSTLPNPGERYEWQNIGGQLLPKHAVASLIEKIKNNKIDSWTDVHQCYLQNAEAYATQKLQHAMASALELTGMQLAELSGEVLKDWLQQAAITKEWMTAGIHTARAKDYDNSFRKMPYDSMEEMEEVVGKLSENVFINEQQEALQLFRKKVNDIIQMP